jgi:NitT/TauT family transport system substrate-binding protein
VAIRFSLRAINIMLLIGVVSALTSCDYSKMSSQTIDHAKPLVNIGRLICGGHLPLAIVEKQFQRNLKSFKLNTVQNHDWNDVVNDLKSGKLSGTFILSPLAMKIIRDGLPAKIVLKSDRNGNGFVLSKKIKSIKALRNIKSILAVPHIYSQHHILLHMVLRQNNVPPQNVTIIGMPPRDMIGSLRRGEIDGFVVGEPEANKSIALEVGWMAAISPQIWKNHPDHVFLATDRFIEENPVQLQELVSTLVQSGKFIEANPSKAALMGEDYTGSSAAIFEQVLISPLNYIDYNDMIPSGKDIKALSEKLVDMGLWKGVPDDLSRFIDLRFIKGATQEKKEQVSNNSETGHKEKG